MKKKLSKKWNALSKVEKEDFMAKSKESSKQYSLQKGVGPKVNFLKWIKNFITYVFVAIYINVNMFYVHVSFQLYLQNRCSPKQVIRVIEELEPKQNTAIQKIGFGSLLQLQCRKIDHGLCLWLINSFNLNTYMLDCIILVSNYP